MANGEWPPYTSEKLTYYGIYSHIVSEAFAMEGIEVKYQFTPWARGYNDVKSGVIDGSITWAKTPEKETEVIFSDPVFIHQKVIFHLTSLDFNWETIEDLKGLSIGATREYTYGHEFDFATKQKMLHVEFTQTDLQSMKKLLASRIDLFPADINVGYNLLHTHFNRQAISLVTHHNRSIQEVYTHVIFSKKNPERSTRLAITFNNGLRKLKAKMTGGKSFTSFQCQTSERDCILRMHND
nr:transporter substrate-binding domain-containing protein [Marinibactrum halimedae]